MGIDYQEVVRRLIGPINPVGSTDVDEERLKNLKSLCHLVNKLVQDIDRVAYDNRYRQEHSIKECVDYARKFIDETLGIK